MVQITIFSLLALVLSSYGSSDSEQQGLEKPQYSKYQWASEIRLSGAYRFRGKGFASLSTPDGNFWVTEGRSALGYKLIKLDLSKSKPSALIQKGDQQAWVGLRSGMAVPVNREMSRQKLESRGGLRYVKGETEPFTGTSIKYCVDGSKSFEMPYVNGKPYGTAVEYNEDGSKSADYVFEYGKEISRKKY